MKNRYILIVFLVGMMVTTIGSLFTLIHAGPGDLLLAIGTLLEVLAGFLLLIKLLKTKNTWNGWLDS